MPMLFAVIKLSLRSRLPTRSRVNCSCLCCESVCFVVATVVLAFGLCFNCFFEILVEVVSLVICRGPLKGPYDPGGSGLDGPDEFVATSEELSANAPCT